MVELHLICQHVGLLMPLCTAIGISPDNFCFNSSSRLMKGCATLPKRLTKHLIAFYGITCMECALIICHMHHPTVEAD
jgi:hypothetical protein